MNCIQFKIGFTYYELNGYSRLGDCLLATKEDVVQMDGSIAIMPCGNKRPQTIEGIKLGKVEADRPREFSERWNEDDLQKEVKAIWDEIDWNEEAMIIYGIQAVIKYLNG